MDNQINIIFIGTAMFGVPSFKALINEPDFNICLVITQPDHPAGRKQALRPSPVKEVALDHKIPILQPNSIIDITQDLADRRADLIVLIAYAQLLPKVILKIPKFGAINLHGSLLPRYRGAACVPWPIINGDKTTGVSFIKMSNKYDTGPILAQSEIPIEDNDTVGSLSTKLSELGAGIIVPTIKDYIVGKIAPREQNENEANYVSQLTKADGQIDWARNAVEIERFIRAMQPWPGAFGEVQSDPPAPPGADRRQAGKCKVKSFKIIEVGHRPIEINEHQPGILFEHNHELAIQCGQNSLIINKIQPSGKKPITGIEFLRGYTNLVGKQLV